MKKINISYNSNKEMWVSNRTEKDITTVDDIINIVNAEPNDEIRKDINYELQKVIKAFKSIEEYFLNAESKTETWRNLEVKLTSNDYFNMSVQVSQKDKSKNEKIFDLSFIKTSQNQKKYSLCIEEQIILEVINGKIFFYSDDINIIRIIFKNISSLYYMFPSSKLSNAKTISWQTLDNEQKIFILNVIKPNWFNHLVINKMVDMTKNTVKVFDSIQDKYYMCNGEYIKFDYRINIESKNSQKIVFNMYNIKNTSSKYNIVLELNSEDKYYDISVSENKDIKMSCRLNFITKQKQVRDWDYFVVKTVEEQHFDSLEVEILDICLPGRVNSILWMFV